AAQQLRAAGGEDAAGALELELERLDAAALAVEGVLRTAAADPALHDRVLRAVGALVRVSVQRQGLLGLGQAPQGAGGEDELAKRRSRAAGPGVTGVAHGLAPCKACNIYHCHVCGCSRPVPAPRPEPDARVVGCDS